jgi:hypothetical protein
VIFAAGVADELIVPIGDAGPIAGPFRFAHFPIWHAMTEGVQ